MAKDLTSVSILRETQNIIDKSIDRIYKNTGIKYSKGDYICLLVKKFHNFFGDMEINHFNKEHDISDIEKIIEEAKDYE